MKYLLLETFDSLLHCRSPCGERGLKLLAAGVLCWRLGRSPCGERGLKYPRLALDILQRRRSPCGERGLKYRDAGGNRRKRNRRSPCGERGLKCLIPA